MNAPGTVGQSQANVPPRNPGRAPGPGAGWSFDVASLVSMTLAALAIGSLVNATRAHPLPWRYVSRQQSMDATLAQLADKALTPVGSGATRGEPAHEIGLEDFRVFALEHRGLVVDARPDVFYSEAHVPGAVNIPRETFGEDYPRLRPRLDTWKDRPVVIYCSGADCPDSELVAEALTKLGFRQLTIYTSGWDEWSQTGLPQETHPNSL